jgi:hypothetical protein
MQHSYCCDRRGLPMAAHTPRPRYRPLMVRGTGRPSCRAFLMPTVGCTKMGRWNMAIDRRRRTAEGRQLYA